MCWEEKIKPFLESEVFKGRIKERRKGRGGLIYIVEQDGDPDLVAYKTVQEFESSLLDGAERIDHEARNWFQFAGHPLIITPHFIKYCNGFPLICMPYCDGDLSDFVGGNLDFTSVVCLSLQIVKGMMVANSRGMDHHQDVKPENLLYMDLRNIYPDFPSRSVDISVKYSVRIADFGVANAWTNKHPGGTNAYKAPEQHDPALYKGFAPDMFGVGVVIAELFQGYHPALTGPGKDVSKWRGAKLKKWSIGGDRHFAPSCEPLGQELIKLLSDMLSADPNNRPSFQNCYKRLSSILKSLSPFSLKQIEELFKYYDYCSEFLKTEDEIDRRLRLWTIPSQRGFVHESFKEDLAEALEKGEGSLENVLRVHHLSNAFHRICEMSIVQEDSDLLIRSSILIVNYVLEHHETIKSESVVPRFSPSKSNSKRLISDLEAKAEILNNSIKRLQQLGAYDEQLERAVEGGGALIQACRVMNEASKAWKAGRIDHACELLEKVRLLAPEESELEKLYNMWINTRESLKELLNAPH